LSLASAVAEDAIKQMELDHQRDLCRFTPGNERRSSAARFSGEPDQAAPESAGKKARG
jgi:hypothetical protein